MFKSRRPDHERLAVRGLEFTVLHPNASAHVLIAASLVAETNHLEHETTVNGERRTANPFLLQSPLTLASLAFLEKSGRSTAW